MCIRWQQKRSTANGFTIVELLIAVSVFSLVLILITTGVLNFSRQYYKGVISGRTQDTARGILDDITRSIQFNGGDVAPLVANPGRPVGARNPIVGYCVGESKRYRFYLNSEVTDASPIAVQHQARHALVSDSVAGCNANTSAPSVQNSVVLPGTNARELLGSHMRLTNFDITGSGNLWTVTVRVVYGDDQFLCDPGAPGSSPANCRNQNPPLVLPNGVNLGNLTCRSVTGSQFCAVSELTTTIDKRVSRVN